MAAFPGQVFQRRQLVLWYYGLRPLQEENPNQPLRAYAESGKHISETWLKSTGTGLWTNSSWLQGARSPEVEPIAKEPRRAVVFFIYKKKNKERNVEWTFLSSNFPSYC
jgi:hypothetical protein